eukprot:scaffold33594_cov201-Skeletonema_dohrnii-CCMP3373.AAC.5
MRTPARRSFLYAVLSQGKHIRSEIIGQYVGNQGNTSLSPIRMFELHSRELDKKSEGKRVLS